MNNSAKKIALITGCAKRIGASIANYLAKRNWMLVLHYHSSENEIIKLAEKLDKITKIFLIKSDLSNSDDVESLINNINNKFGIINLLINNASNFTNDNLSKINNTTLNKHLQINLNAPLLLSKNMAKQKNMIDANIINILDCSIANLAINFLSYKISKSALAYATKSIAISLSPNIRVNAICPGPIIKHNNQSAENFYNLCNKTPLGHSATTLEICRTISYIIKTRSMTGQLIFLDGGANLTNHIDY